MVSIRSLIRVDVAPQYDVAKTYNGKREVVCVLYFDQRAPEEGE